MVEQILANHSQVLGLGEIAELTNIAGALDNRPGSALKFLEAAAKLGASGLEEMDQQTGPFGGYCYSLEASVRCTPEDQSNREPGPD